LLPATLAVSMPKIIADDGGANDNLPLSRGPRARIVKSECRSFASHVCKRSCI